MSNFAERLVARSAGAPLGSGISVLAPRPASRFEPVSGTDIEMGVGRESSDIPIATPVGTDAEAEIGSPIARSHMPMTRTHIEGDGARQPIEGNDTERSMPHDNAIREPSYEVDIARPVLRKDTTLQPVPERVIPDLSGGEIFMERGQAPNSPMPTDTALPATPRQPVRADVDASRSDERQRSGPVPPPTTSDRPREADAIHAEQRATMPVTQTATVREWKGEPPPAPVISIGTIEVQFLPQEPRPPAPRSQPQRTRGFEGYARARRGEPR